MILFYNILLLIITIMFSPFIIPVLLLSGKRRKTFLPRLGISKILSGFTYHARPAARKQTLWVHALSVGEVLSAVPLVKKLGKDIADAKIVFSVSTKTGYEIAGNLLPEAVDTVFFFPYDLYFSVKSVARKIDPALVVIVESDIWPNFLCEMKNRSVPVLLVNARLSDRSFKKYRQFSFIIKRVLASFAVICAQSGQDAERYLTAGIPAEIVTVTGNIKFDQESIAFSEAETLELKNSLQITPDSKILLAGSTHQGEESIISEVFGKLKKEMKELVLIIAPRNPERAESVYGIYQSAGYSAVQLKDIHRTDSAEGYDVIIIDIIGILNKLYSIADAAFIGGSLVKRGGHNPLEPAAFSKPIIFGPDMSNFAEISDMLLKAGAARQVLNAADFYEVASRLLLDKKEYARMGKNAYAVFADNKGAVEKVINEIRKLLKPL